MLLVQLAASTQWKSCRMPSTTQMTSDEEEGIACTRIHTKLQEDATRIVSPQTARSKQKLSKLNNDKLGDRHAWISEQTVRIEREKGEERRR